MALHLTPEEHDADPPDGWVVEKRGDKWAVLTKTGVLVSEKTKKAATAHKTGGPFFDLYQKEGRWFRGERVEGWKPYSVIVEERHRRQEWQRIIDLGKPKKESSDGSSES
jgi:hypothetical protein